MGFNGATDFHRWKADALAGLPSRQAGFNGATDFHRWKDGSMWTTVAGLFTASMGPPIFIGGKAEDCEVVQVFSALQWGHRFSSVERQEKTEQPPRQSRFNGATDFHRWKDVAP